jgi:heme oxygenase
MTTDILEPSRARRLKALTHETHDRLDTSIMAAASFATVEGYGRFVTVQYLFHRDIDALYDDALLQALLPGLLERRRLPLIAADLTDLPTNMARAISLPPPMGRQRIGALSPPRWMRQT